MVKAFSCSNSILAIRHNILGTWKMMGTGEDGAAKSDPLDMLWIFTYNLYPAWIAKAKDRNPFIPEIGLIFISYTE